MRVTSFSEPTFAEQRLELGDVEQSGVGVDLPFLDHATDAFGSAADGAGVGFVILVGDDHLVAGPEHVGEREGEHVRVRRGRRTEHDLAGFHPERFGPSFTRAIDQLTAAS